MEDARSRGVKGSTELRRRHCTQVLLFSYSVMRIGYLRDTAGRMKLAAPEANLDMSILQLDPDAI